MYYKIVYSILIGFFLKLIPLSAQIDNNKYLFRPSLISDTSKSIYNDSTKTELQTHKDSLKREQIRIDSIKRITKIKDSINLLKNKLQFILECYFKANHENIPISNVTILTSADTAILKAEYFLLPFNLNQPYKPWKYELNLLSNNFKVTYDDAYQIIRINSNAINIDIGYHKNIVVIKDIHSILNNKYGNYYKVPVDSIFLDNNKKIIRIKRYAHFYKLIKNSEKGDYLFTNTTYVKQFFYNQANNISKIQVVNFSDRWYNHENQKITSIINYEIVKNNNTYILSRKSDPENNYADGKYTYEFDQSMNLVKVDYTNEHTSESWHKEIELNKEGFVHCYYDYIKNKLKQSLCILYNYSKNAYETITTIFEDDGISYFQRNNTTGKIRRRNRLTLEWGPWE